MQNIVEESIIKELEGLKTETAEDLRKWTEERDGWAQKNRELQRSLKKERATAVNRIAALKEQNRREFSEVRDMMYPPTQPTPPALPNTELWFGFSDGRMSPAG